MSKTQKFNKYIKSARKHFTHREWNAYLNALDRQIIKFQIRNDSLRFN